MAENCHGHEFIPICITAVDYICCTPLFQLNELNFANNDLTVKQRELELNTFVSLESDVHLSIAHIIRL